MQDDKPFRFKQFSVVQSRSSMKVGTDAVLLGSWAEVRGAQRILDVGSGNGVIALICAQRNPTAVVHAIELDQGSVEDAAYNFLHAPWSNRMTIAAGDFLQFEPMGHFDFVISNPPFFSQSIRASDPVRSKARHDDSLPADMFMRHTSALLSENGIVAVIIPFSQMKKWLSAGAEASLLPRRICHVYTLADRMASRVMIEFSVDYAGEPRMESLLIERRPGEFSEAYKELTHDFYTRW